MKAVTQFLVPYLAIGLAGSAGSILRYVVGNVSGRVFRTTFPVGTFIINITGSLFLGWFLTRYRDVVSENVRIGIAVGFVGAYTTFSTFMYESSKLFEDGEGIKALVNLLGSLLVGLVAVRAGIWLAMREAERGVAMSLQGEQVLFRAYLDSADRTPHTPTHERLVKAARSEALAGATVLRGILGARGRDLIKPSPWSLVEHVPVIVEIVDSAERIRKFLEGAVSRIMLDGMITLERANVMLYRHRWHDQPNSLAMGGLLAPLSTLPRIEERGTMKVHENGVLLRIFIGESDRFENQRLHEAVIGKARELGIAGATVLRGTEGFGAHSVVHRASLLDMSTDLPVVIEIVDQEEPIQRLLPHLEQMIREGMITMEYVRILLYRQNAGAKTEDA